MKYLSGIKKTSQFQENQNVRSLSESKASYGAGHLENHFAADPITKSSFQTGFPRQSILTPSHSESVNNPKSTMSFNSAGLSLPTSPSDFSPGLDAIFKPDSFVCSSPKQSRKVQNPSSDAAGDFLIPHSPSFSQSSTSPGHKNKKTFDFEETPITSNLFTYHENPENSSSHNSSYFTSRESNISNKDSFIAQVTRDLAKMNTVDKSISGSPNSKATGNNFSLFKS